MIQSWNGDSSQMENSLQFQCGRLAGKQIKDSFYNTIMLLPTFVKSQLDSIPNLTYNNYVILKHKEN